MKYLECAAQPTTVTKWVLYLTIIIYLSGLTKEFITLVLAEATGGKKGLEEIIS